LKPRGATRTVPGSLSAYIVTFERFYDGASAVGQGFFSRYTETVTGFEHYSE
jgi:hypothetical protein